MIAFFPSTVTPVTHFLHAETLFCPLPKLLPEFPGSHLQECHAYFHHLIYANSTNSRSRPSVLFSTKVSRKIAGLPVLTIVYVKSIRASNPPISGPASLLKMPFQLIKFIWLFICKYFLKNYDRCLPDFIIFHHKLFFWIHVCIKQWSGHSSDSETQYYSDSGYSGFFCRVTTKTWT